jgi:uncharacterized repeat protein (TIGR03943 family)
MGAAVRRVGQGSLLFAVGLNTVYLSASGRYLWFLKPGIRFPMTATGVLLVALGAWTLWPCVAAYVNGEDDPVTGDRTPDHDAYDHHGTAHRGPPVGWLLALPLVALALVSPPPLSADAARHEMGRAVPVPRYAEFPPLPLATDGPVELRVSAFVARATYDRHESLAGVRVRLTGFVVRDPDVADGYLLTRFSLACCAADAFASQVEVRGVAGLPPPEDSWVVVVGQWQWLPASGRSREQTEDPPVLMARSQTLIEAPTDPYE